MKADFILKLSWKPGAFHGRTVRNTITRSLWTKIRAAVLVDGNKTCTICGFVPKNDLELRQLHVHEVEEYSGPDIHPLVCTLIGLELICDKCHSFHHWGRTASVLSKEQLHERIEHFLEVNKCTKAEFIEHLNQVKTENRQQMMEMLKGPIKIPHPKDLVVHFRVAGEIPFKEEVISQLMKKGLYYQ